MGMSEALAEGPMVFYQARLPPDRPPAARKTWRETDRWRSGRSRTLGKRV